MLIEMLKYDSLTRLFLTVPIVPNSNAMLNDVSERGTGMPAPNVMPYLLIDCP